MSISNNDLKEVRRFHLANPSEFEGLDEWALWLESILHNPCSIFVKDGESFLIETKQLVERLAGMRIDIYPNEHPPPHFHTKSPDVDACFTIEDCLHPSYLFLQDTSSPTILEKLPIEKPRSPTTSRSSQDHRLYVAAHRFNSSVLRTQLESEF